MSLHPKLVPVQYREYEYGLLLDERREDPRSPHFLRGRSAEN